MKPMSDQIYRILDVFEFMQNDCIYPANSTPEHDDMLKADSDRIRERYKELRWRADMSFSDAMKIARAEYIYWVFSGCPTPDAPELGKAQSGRDTGEGWGPSGNRPIR